MRKLTGLFALAVVVAGQFVASNSFAGAGLDKALGAHCGRSACILTNNPGGEVQVFMRAAQEVLAEGKHLRIAGLCASACVLMADMARDNTCMTADAQFAVHKEYVFAIIGRSVANGEETPVGRL